MLEQIGKKIIRLKEDPHAVGGELGGKLHGKKSTRLIRKYRLIFSIYDKEKIVYLEAIDHRGHAYD